MRVAVLINPVSGAKGHPGAGPERAALASRVLAEAGADPWVRITTRPGHAPVLAREALAAGADVVAAWGGDGTVNEVASALVGGQVPLGIVPGGSGNGLARELGLPLQPAAALALLAHGRERVLDAGEVEGRLFFNVAGVGLDARIAMAFAASRRRGLAGYVAATVRELFASLPVGCTVSVDGSAFRMDVLMVAIANSSQYGNGLVIAPKARLDDGALDVVAVGARSPVAALWHVPALFSGRADRVPGVTVAQTSAVTISAEVPLACHVDGEPFMAGSTVRARVRPAALRVRVR